MFKISNHFQTYDLNVMQMYYIVLNVYNNYVKLDVDVLRTPFMHRSSYSSRLLVVYSCFVEILWNGEVFNVLVEISSYYICNLF